MNCRIKTSKRPIQCYKCWFFGHHGFNHKPFALGSDKKGTKWLAVQTQQMRMLPSMLDLTDVGYKQRHSRWYQLNKHENTASKFKSLWGCTRSTYAHGTRSEAWHDVLSRAIQSSNWPTMESQLNYQNRYLVLWNALLSGYKTQRWLCICNNRWHLLLKLLGVT